MVLLHNIKSLHILFTLIPAVVFHIPPLAIGSQPLCYWCFFSHIHHLTRSMHIYRLHQRYADNGIAILELLEFFKLLPPLLLLVEEASPSQTSGQSIDLLQIWKVGEEALLTLMVSPAKSGGPQISNSLPQLSSRAYPEVIKIFNFQWFRKISAITSSVRQQTSRILFFFTCYRIK